MHRRIEQLIDAQERWAKPVGEKVQGLLGQLFAEARPVKDALNGVWLGHPVHPAVTDVPVGALTAAAVLDLAGYRKAADLATFTGVAGMTASAATGVADAVDAYGKPQVAATVHATIMVASLGAYLGSLCLRATGGSRATAVALSMTGYAGVLAGAYVGGDLVYRFGNMVDRHAFTEEGPPTWQRLDVADVPEGQVVRGMMGEVPLALHRDGDDIFALHAVCAHAGGPLDEGTVVDGCVECPWHQSHFRWADGRVEQGPSVYDQPAYEVRRTEDGGLEARLLEVAAGDAG